MNIVIVGPGSIGCLFAALLSHGGHRVALLDRDPARAARLSRSGLRVQTMAGESLTADVCATADPLQIPFDADILCLCVKGFDTAAAIRSAAPAIRPGCSIVSLQNGLRNAEIIEQCLPAAPLACAVTFHGATRLAEGRIIHAGSGTTEVAPWRADNPLPAARFSAALAAAGVDCTPVDNAHSMLWRKLTVNAAINPLTAVHRVPNGTLLRDPALRDLLRATATETAAVAAALGIPLGIADPAGAAENACARTADNRSSMLQDVLAGRRTEIESMNGAVVEAAAGIGLAAPLNHALLEQVRELERRRIRQPDGI